MASKKPTKKDAAKAKTPKQKVDVKDLDTKKNPKGGPITSSWLPG